MPTPPVDVPINTTGQWIMAVLVIVGLIATLFASVQMSRRLHTWGPMVVIVGSLLAGFIEPIYDTTLHLWYYVPGQWTMYSVLGTSQPIWAWLSYGPFYGGLTLLVWWRVEQGATRASIAKLAGLLVVVGLVTELAFIRLGTYEYYGEHPFRVFDYPMWISVANGVVGVVAGIVAARLRPILAAHDAWAYVALVPVAMTAIHFGTGFLIIDVINTPDPATWLMYLTATMAMALGATVAFVALKLVPVTGLADPVARSSDAPSKVAPVVDN